MQTDALTTTSSQPECSRIETVARQWAATFAELFCVSLKERGPRFVDLWVSALADLKPEVLDAACRRAMQTCKFFPTPVEILGKVEQADASAFGLKAEQAWRELLAWIRCYVIPDVGIAREAPPLPPAVAHAAAAAGGVFFLEHCSEDELGWRKKDFIRDYTTIHETGRVEHLLSDGQAKRILAELARPTERQRLAVPQGSELEASGLQPSDQQVRADLAALRERLAAESAVAYQAPNEAEWERRRAEQLARLRTSNSDLRTDLCTGKRRRSRGCSQCNGTGVLLGAVSGSLCPCEAWRQWTPPRQTASVATAE